MIVTDGPRYDGVPTDRYRMSEPFIKPESTEGMTLQQRNGR